MKVKNLDGIENIKNYLKDLEFKENLNIIINHR